MNNKLNFLNSQEEYFYYWLKELEEHGYVKNIKFTEESYELNKGLNISLIKLSGKKLTPKNSSKKLISIRTYTPDFIFEFTEKAKDIFYYKENDVESLFPLISKDNRIYIDTKGEYTLHFSSSITFGDRQAMMWDKHQIYVQIVKPFINKEKGKSLFESTFTPKLVIKKEIYKKDNAVKKIKKGDSKIKFKVRTLNEFLSKYEK